jgi:hypothetical protein
MPITLNCFPESAVRVDARSHIEGGVPETRTHEPPMPMPSASTPFTPGERLWTGRTAGKRRDLQQKPFSLHFSPFLTVFSAVPRRDSFGESKGRPFSASRAPLKMVKTAESLPGGYQVKVVTGVKEKMRRVIEAADQRFLKPE